MPLIDIRPIKEELRRRSREFRAGLTPEQKQALDDAITARVLSLWQYRQCRVLLTYVSTPIEVDTRRLIERALADGKRVAVPRCVPGTRDMEFFYIRSLSELEPGAFGVLEPVPERAERMTDFSEGLCIVPALYYDYSGFRLGYGKGYYDRFLAHFGGTMIGVEYSRCVKRSLPHGRFDRPVTLLVTDRYIRRSTEQRSDFHDAQRQPVPNRKLGSHRA